MFASFLVGRNSVLAKPIVFLYILGAKLPSDEIIIRIY